MVLAACLIAFACPDPASAQSSLERARALYNAGQFQEAIALAAGLEGKPATAPSASLIAARARLELFRKSADPSGLAAARAALASLDPQALAPQELVEWQVGLGSVLFLENQPGPAAEIFTTVLSAARSRFNAVELEKFLEWWGMAASQAAGQLSGDARTRAFEALRTTAALELERNPFSKPAAYWTVVAARGAGDLEGAWRAAVAGWIRAGRQQSSRQLRTDLDTFVTQTLIPERAQARTGQRIEGRATVADIAAQTEEWRAITARWGGQN